MSDFNPETDYLKEIPAEDKWAEGGKEYPYLRGLKNLAYKYRGGVREVKSEVVKAPSVNIQEKGNVPDCIAAVTVTYVFADGTSFAGSADASYKAHSAPFNLHLVAIAESKAEARAIRRAFNISQVSKEEMGTPPSEEELKEEAEKESDKISDTQIHAIKSMASKKKVSQAELLAKLGRSDLPDVRGLTYAEGIKSIKLLNSWKVKD